MTPGSMPLDLDWLATFNLEKGLHLVTADRAGFVYLAELNAANETNGPSADAARAYVTELVRLAQIGQRVERAAADTVRRRKTPDRVQ